MMMIEWSDRAIEPWSLIISYQWWRDEMEAYGAMMMIIKWDGAIIDDCSGAYLDGQRNYGVRVWW